MSHYLFVTIICLFVCLINLINLISFISPIFAMFHSQPTNIIHTDLYTMPLNRDEYILDITTELLKNGQIFYLIFCRSVWFYPLRLDSHLYIEVVFNQIAPDYLEGLLLVMPNEQLSQRNVLDIARVAALLHRAAGMEEMPNKEEVKYLLPKPILSFHKPTSSSSSTATTATANNSNQSTLSTNNNNNNNGQQQQSPTANNNNNNSGNSSLASVVSGYVKPQKWIDMVQKNWNDMTALDTLDAKAQCLDILQKWPLFGSCFFAIKLIRSDTTQHSDHILALNRMGVHMLDMESHETQHRYPYSEVISTRKVRSEDGTLYLDLKCGNLMHKTITRIQTDQAHEISRLIKQYIDIEQSHRNGCHKNNMDTPANIISKLDIKK